MPEVCQVLCCYNCDMFQVHFLKKSNKWRCLICNEKQSLKKAFRIGPAPQCRSLVQELNMQKANQKDNPAPHCRSVVRGLDMQKVCQIRNLNEDDTAVNEKYVPDLNKVNEEEDRIDNTLRYRTPGGDEMYPALRNFIDRHLRKLDGNHGKKNAEMLDLRQSATISDFCTELLQKPNFVRNCAETVGENAIQNIGTVKSVNQETTPVYQDEKQASENDYLSPEGIICDINETQMGNRIFTRHKNGEEPVQVVKTKNCHGQKKRPFENVTDLISVFLSDDSDEETVMEDGFFSRYIKAGVPVTVLEAKDCHGQKQASENYFLPPPEGMIWDIDETQMGNRIFTRHKKGEEPVQVFETKNCHGQKKQPFENVSDGSSRTLAPPFKKNRGFEIIKNAASKLN